MRLLEMSTRTEEIRGSSQGDAVLKKDVSHPPTGKPSEDRRKSADRVDNTESGETDGKVDGRKTEYGFGKF